MTQIADADDSVAKRISGGHLGETRNRHPAPAQLQAKGLQRSGGICDQRRFRTRQTPRGILKPPPSHTAGSVAYAADGIAFVGDVLFAGSIGRTDLAGGDLDTLIASIEMLVRELPPETVVASGHGPASTLARELATNPFLDGLR